MVSVIMCTYKEKVEYISNAVLSILNQTYSDIELIIIVDDPSNQNAINYLNETSRQDKRVKLYFNETNKGLVFSLNRALEIAKGEYIARMDADDYSYPNRIEEQMKHIAERKADLVGCFTNHIDMAGNKTGGGFQDSLALSRLYDLLKLENFIPHPTWLVKKSLYRQLDGYRPIPYSEDYDFLLRAIHHGASLSVLNIPLVDYRINEEGISQKNNFKQIIVTKFLSKNRDRIEEIGLDDIRRIIEKKDNEAAKKRFESGMNQLKKAGSNIANRKYVIGSLRIIYGFLISSISRYKIINLIKKNIYRKRSSVWL